MTKKKKKKATIHGGEATHFITVDLDIFSRQKLTYLAEALGNAVFVLHEGRWNSRYAAILELGFRSSTTVDGEIRKFISLIKKLPEKARHLWDSAQTRTFNIGIQAGLHPHAHVMKISNKTMEEAVQLGAGVTITTYAPYMETNRDNNKEKHKGRLTTA